ncbi:MAG: nitroreductase family protein [Actinomycetota bacterium]|nr:nitroreductase family protein [Actinomycetota bacterium]
MTIDLEAALLRTGAVRDFTAEPVSDAALSRLLDVARFAPSGGNRQGWRVVVLKDPATRRALRDLYLPGWYEYLAQGAAGLVAFSPLNDPDEERAAITNAPAFAEAAAQSGGGFAEHLDSAPVLLAVFARLGDLAATDRDLDRYHLVGGASIYPFVWSLLLAARLEGLGGVMTTMATRAEPQVAALLGATDEHALAAVVALGHPAHRPGRLRRAPVEEFTTIDRLGGAPLRPPDAGR